MYQTLIFFQVYSSITKITYIFYTNQIVNDYSTYSTRFRKKSKSVSSKNRSLSIITKAIRERRVDDLRTKSMKYYPQKWQQKRTSDLSVITSLSNEEIIHWSYIRKFVFKLLRSLCYIFDKASTLMRQNINLKLISNNI